jgi:hypothetical protein
MPNERNILGSFLELLKVKHTMRIFYGFLFHKNYVYLLIG